MNGVQREMREAKAWAAEAKSDAASEDHIPDQGQESREQAERRGDN